MAKAIKAVQVEINKERWDARNESHAVILRNEEIRIFGAYNGRPFDKTFKMGDMAEYDSYNLSYYGSIVGITENSVTIQEKYGSTPRRHRLKLYNFIWRNQDFDLTVKAAENAETSYYI